MDVESVAFFLWKLIKTLNVDYLQGQEVQGYDIREIGLN